MKRYILTLVLLLSARLVLAQYCTPSYMATGIAAGAMGRVTVTGNTGVLLNDTLPVAILSSGYVDRSGTVLPVVLRQGRPYTLTVRYYAAEGHTGNQVWMDMNNDGYFADSEAVSVVVPASSSFFQHDSVVACTVNVPLACPVGVHKLRVRNVVYNMAGTSGIASTGIDPCNSSDYLNSYSSGTTADYRVSISAASACSGSPVPGTVTGPAWVCHSSPFNMSLQNDTIAAGLTYQWFRISGTAVPIAGATNRYYNMATQATATNYFVTVACASGTAVNTPPRYVGQNAFYNCYCNAALGGNAFDATIDSVALPGTTLQHGSRASRLPYIAYADTGTATAVVMRGATYTLLLRGGGYSRYSAGMWIDFDNSGTYDNSEFFPVTNSAVAGGVSVCTFSVPLTADTGKAGMRIRTAIDLVPFTSLDACRYSSSGQTQDFILFINPATACTGVPAMSGLTATTTGACPGVPFTLFPATFHFENGIDYQWYERPATGGAFTPCPAGTGQVLSVPSQVVATQYMLTATCVATGGSDSSTVHLMPENPFYLCYCAPGTGVSLNSLTTVALLDSVAIDGTPLNNRVVGDTGVYQSYYPPVATTTAVLQTGYPYPITVKASGSAPYHASVWLDYDRNGRFDASEQLVIASGAAAGTVSGNVIMVPAAADTGYTGLRVRTAAAPTGDGCEEQFYGTTHDYVVQILPGAPCSGVPAAGFAASTDSLVCPASTFDLISRGSLATTGITYQWLSRSFTGTYTPLAGATTTTFTHTGQLATTIYALKVTCALSGLSDTSLDVTVHQEMPYICACTPLSGSLLNDSAFAAPVDSFVLYGTNLYDSTSWVSGTYALRTSFAGGGIPVLTPGAGYVFSISSGGTLAYQAAVWIDLDKNGAYDTYEYFPVSVSGLPGRPLMGSILLPAGAASGITGLRLRTFPAGYTPTAADACTYVHYGATRDYAVAIATAAPCSGMPGPYTVRSTFDSVCAGQAFQLYGSGLSVSSGLRMQWEAAPLSTGIFTAISGATDLVYDVPGQAAPTLYRLIAWCVTGGGADSTVYTRVEMNPFYLCYCSPYTGTALHTVAAAAPDSVAIAGTTINSTAGNGRVYRQFYPLTAANSDSLSRGGSYTLYLNSVYGPYNADVWLDLNQNGIFDNTEQYHAATSVAGGTVSSVVIAVPYSVPTGYTGLRVRVTEAGFPMSATDACTPEALGATYDYVVNIAYGVPCTGTPVAGTAAASATTVCAGTSFTLTDTGYSVGAGITYQWYSRLLGSGTFAPITGATNMVHTIAAQVAATEYRLVATCATSGSSAASNTVTVLQTPHYACYCAGTLGATAASTQFRNIQIHGSALHISGAFAPPYRLFGMAGDSTGTLQRTYAYPLDLTVAGGSAYNAGMWIDYDHSGSFENSEYIRLDTNAASGAASTTTFAVPATADTGITGVRIRTTQSSNVFDSSDACTYYANSQTFDLRMRIDTLVRCSGTPHAGTVSSISPFACPSMSFRLNNVGYGVGTGYSYQWMARTSGAYTAITGATTYSTVITGQAVTTSYIMVARCSYSGLTDTSNVLVITENPFDSCYCSPPTGVTLVTSGGHHNILATTLAGVTTMSVPEQYPDSTGYVAVPPVPAAYTTTLRRYAAYPLTVFVNYPAYTISAAGVWVDFNHNSVFDSAEYTALAQSADRSNWSASIAIPATATPGLTGMRIITREGGALSASGACGRVPVGQVQDHIINIQPAPCFSIASGTVTGITDSSARGIWGRLAGSLGYRYQFDTTSAPPSGSGTYTADTFAYSGCLISGTRYYLHISDSCDGGVTSGWFTVPFTTLPCAGAATVTASAVTNSAATVSWSSVAGTMGYQYVLDTTATAPTTAGTATTATTCNFTGLTQGTTYYAHIRSGCHCSNQSAWHTISFTTICDTITHLSLVSLTDTSVTIRWDSIAGISSYAYVISTTPGAPASSGVSVSDTMVTAAGLTPGTTYYAHVRHNCSGGYSSWVSIPFTTSRCDTVTGLTGIPNDTGIVIRWTGVAGATTYYWVVNTVAAPPIGTLGTITTNTSDTVGPLYSGTLYYVHVRTGCTGGSSRWVTIPVRTLDCDTVSGLIVSSLCDTAALLNWAASAGGLGYTYTVTTTPSAPTGAGSYSPVNVAVANGLTAGTTYYAHVRHLCGTIDSSAWVTVAFTTPSCTTVTGLTATGINTTGANISWTAISCITGYEYTLDNVPTDPTVAGTFYTVPYVAETSLTPGTTYYVHVRVVCGGGAFSGWVTYSFTTTTCPPSVISVTGITSTSANVNWLPVTGALGYEYAVDNSATPPAFGSYTTATSYFAGALLPAVNYYAHVRVLCGGGTYSLWDNAPFTTAALGVTQAGSQPVNVTAWPNPAEGRITVMVTGAGANGNITLTDLTGKVLMTVMIADGRAELDVAALAAGLYFIRYDDGAHSAVIKMSKQ